MLFHANVRVICLSLGSRKKYQSCVNTGGLMGPSNQLAANAKSLAW